MASGQTKTYGFNQWQPEDKVLREEFNGDNEKMEQALTGLDGRVEGKAEQTEVDGLKTQLATKAAQSSLDALESSLSMELSKKYGSDNPCVVAGSYQGDGAETLFVSTGFRPSFLIIFTLHSNFDYPMLYMMGDQTVQFLISYSSSRWLENNGLLFHENGFTVQSMLTAEAGFNVAGDTYRYIAFR